MPPKSAGASNVGQAAGTMSSKAAGRAMSIHRVAIYSRLLGGITPVVGGEKGAGSEGGWILSANYHFVRRAQ